MASTPTQDIFIPNLPYPNSGIIFGTVDTSFAVCLAQAKRKKTKKKKKKQVIYKICKGKLSSCSLQPAWYIFISNLY